ncbi:hypothetical protein AAC387_Pa11g0697 [Persea americana]
MTINSTPLYRHFHHSNHFSIISLPIIAQSLHHSHLTLTISITRLDPPSPSQDAWQQIFLSLSSLLPLQPTIHTLHHPHLPSSPKQQPLHLQAIATPHGFSSPLPHPALVAISFVGALSHRPHLHLSSPPLDDHPLFSKPTHAPRLSRCNQQPTPA